MNALDTRSAPPNTFGVRSYIKDVRLLAAGNAWKVVLLAFTLTVVEGAVRKWVVGTTFSTVSYLVYFSKDIIFAFVLFLPSRQEHSDAANLFLKWLVPGCLICLSALGISSTEQVNLAGAILTSKHLIVLPILAAAALARLQQVDLRLVIAAIALFVFVNFALGAIQNQLAPNHVLNRYVAEKADIVIETSGVRATGSFSYISGMAVFSSVGVWAGMVYLSLAPTVRSQVFGWALVVAGFGCGLASVSRGPIVYGLAMLVPWLAFSGAWAASKVRSLGAIIILAGLVLLFEISGALVQLTEGVVLRFHTADSASERGRLPFDELVAAIEMFPFGNGVGTEQVGRSALEQQTFAETSMFESPLPRLVQEIGILGFIGYIAIFGGALVALQVARQTTEASGQRAAILATQFYLGIILISVPIFNHVAASFYWLVFTIVMATSGSVPTQRREADLA